MIKVLLLILRPLRVRFHGPLALCLLSAASLSWSASAPSSGAPESSGHIVQSSVNSCDPSIATCLPSAFGGAKGGPITGGSPDLGNGNDPGGSPGNGDGAGMCKAPVNGSPKCGGGGPASQGGGDSGGVEVGSGNPINILSGNKYQEETDMPALPGVLGLELKRYYNSRSVHPGLFGAQWRFSYETVLYDRGSQLQIIQADGRRISFARKPGATICDSSQWSDGQVRIEVQGDKPVFHWRWPDGRVLTFRNGLHGGYPLHIIRAPTGETSSLAYNPLLQLVSVTDPQGRKLLFSYDKRSSLTAVTTPLGRINYQHDKNHRLTEAAYLAGDQERKQTEPYAKRIYHYERERQGSNGFALTGISLQSQSGDKWQTQRLSTFAYNQEGLAILSTKGLPLAQKDGKAVDGTGLEQVQLNYLRQPSPNEGKAGPDGEVRPRTLGLAHLTNSLGQQTTIESAIIGGHYRLIQMRGPGCATCGPSNMQYGYDREGRLLRSTQLDAQGQALQSELRRYDRYGRLVETAVQRFAKGKLQAAQWTQRLAYTDTRFKDGSIALGNQPTSLSQPSVIAGKVHTLSVEYNDKGQPLRVTEEGWSPIDAQGHEQAMAITRSTSYRYSVIDGNSVLTEIADSSSDQAGRTLLTWDAHGSFITQRVDPGAITVQMSHDAAGRIARTIQNDGFRQIQNDIRYSASLDSTVAQRVQTAWLLREGQVDASSRQTLSGPLMSYDAFGHQVQSVDAAGRSVQTRYDLAGNWLGMQDVQGYRVQRRLDTEDRTLMTGLYKPSAEGTDASVPYRAAYFWHDAEGHLTRRLLPDGRLDTWTYAANGALLQHVDGNDIRTAFLHGNQAQAAISQTPDGWIRASLRSAGESGRSGRVDGDKGVRATLQDDFGRIVRQALPDHGVKTALYDVHDRLTALINADGSRVQYQWDAAGRLLRKAYLDGQNKEASQTTLSYQGLLLSRASDPHQTTDYRYDALGRPIGERITLTGLSTPLNTATRYDPETGLIAARTLADGHVLRTQRVDAAHGASPKALSLQQPWAAWLQDQLDDWLPRRTAVWLARFIPAQAVASDIHIDPFDGLQSYRTGNGLLTQKQFDIAGRLTRLAIQGVADLTYGYGVGPRIRTVNQTSGNAKGPDTEARYDYQGFGRLVDREARQPSLIKASYGGDVPDQAPSSADAKPDARSDRQVDAQGRTLFDGRLRYTYTPAGQVEQISDAQGQLLARYRYNSLRQRISKTVFKGGREITTYFLWQQGLLVAEIDAVGQIQTQYLYWTEGTHATPMAKLEAGGIFFIHTDHRATPMAMTDVHQQVVWRADVSPWGVMKTGVPSTSQMLNLRLPGQYFDAETGLHDNWRRSYDPASGRYLQPDPLGYPDGPDAYRYAQGDPVNRMDPTGLYQEDMHYYMVFFLSLAAGLDYESARVTALASQFVDDNEITRPMDDESMAKLLATPLKNKQQLKWYHFTLTDEKGHTLKQYDNDDVASPIDNLSPQLNNLLNASRLGNSDQPCAKFQFLGEFLHAYADTFSHRDGLNRPIDATTFGLGLGHLFSGEEPDYTYNGDPEYLKNGGTDPIVNARWWNVREARTLTAEQAMFSVLQKEKGEQGGAGLSFEEISKALKEFNAIPEHGESSPNKKAKLADYLNAWLAEGRLNLQDAYGKKIDRIDLTDSGSQFGYGEDVARRYRRDFLGDLRGQEDKFPGVCLPDSPICKPV